MSLVEFVETVSEIKLFQYQKEILDKVEEKIKNGEKLTFYYPRGSNRINLLPIYILLYQEFLFKEN